MKRKKYTAPCVDCGKPQRRLYRREVVCSACSKKRDYLKRRALKIVKQRAWRKAHKNHIRAYFSKWRVEHRQHTRNYNRRWRKEQKQAVNEVLDSIPCLDCGMHHTEALRERLLRRMLPASSEEIHEAHQCIWGPSGFEHRGSAGAQRLRRDLQALGAISIGRGEYMLRSAA